ncbi:MAG: hypothetical protein MJZ01_02530 [Bacteroidales bacterium]|nr:hypothetical protein [Bacteroidales bacterium]
MKTIKSIVALMATIMLASCSYRALDFTIVSTKTHAIQVDKNSGKNTEGKSMGFLGLGTSIKDAVDNALSNAGPGYDLLVDGVIYVKDNFFTSGYKVVGIAINTSQMRAELGDKKFEDWLSEHAQNLVSENGTEVAWNNQSK